MKKYFFTIIILLFFLNIEANAALCKKSVLNDPNLDIKMDYIWLKKEELREKKEEELLGKYSDYITKNNKDLTVSRYRCLKGQCDSLRNCQMHKDNKIFHEVEYRIKTDSGLIITKSHCSVIGKCIGYNDFTHNKDVLTSEDRLIDIKKDNAIFYHYFYAPYSKNYEPPFNITNFHTGSELYLNDIPHFSPDERFMVEVRSVPKQILTSEFPTGFAINIYEMNEYGEYKNIELNEIETKNSDKITSTFLSRNKECGETPYFHSWKSNTEIRLSMLPPQFANMGKKVILFYDRNTKKWQCQEDIFPQVKCESYLPNSTKFTSNLAEEQINGCRKDALIIKDRDF